MKSYLLIAALSVACAAVQAREVTRAVYGPQTLVLTNSSGSCPEGTELAVYLHRDGDVTPACWRYTGGKVRVIEGNGATRDFPVEVFKPAVLL